MQPHHSDDATPPSWRQRPKPIGLEIGYQIDGHTLEIETSRKVERVRLSAVEQVRFVYAPSNVTSKGYKTQLRCKGGKVVSFGNLSWRSLTDVDRDDARYHAFVAALAAAIAAANPRARFVAGKPRAAWLAMTLIGGGLMAVVALFSLRAFTQATAQGGWLGVILLAACCWQIWPMVSRNRPRELALGEVPDALVPGRTA